jgi:hypothetical protein
MSGGYLTYNDRHIGYMLTDIKEEIDRNDHRFDEKTMNKFREAVKILEKASIMVNRIDYLLSGDDSEETFHERWEKEFIAQD